ncbi:hypothetical protein [Helicobacter didelphidarum]|uniref:hypothetical protein n=1 Tax=Helicobacter didelphidarum TaxID=2040648 RepID=UPI0015F1998C|nr:hypothetical protein [Helicobacter didelphidarum]
MKKDYIKKEVSGLKSKESFKIHEALENLPSSPRISTSFFYFSYYGRWYFAR